MTKDLKVTIPRGCCNTMGYADLNPQFYDEKECKGCTFDGVCRNLKRPKDDNDSWDW